jgi:hypothetical protein
MRWHLHFVISTEAMRCHHHFILPDSSALYLRQTGEVNIGTRKKSPRSLDNTCQFGKCYPMIACVRTVNCPMYCAQQPSEPALAKKYGLGVRTYLLELSWGQRHFMLSWMIMYFVGWRPIHDRGRHFDNDAKPPERKKMTARLVVILYTIRSGEEHRGSWPAKSGEAGLLIDDFWVHWTPWIIVSRVKV